MKRISSELLTGILTTFAVALAANVAQAAIPSLSPDELRKSADLIFTGTVTDVKEEHVAVDFGEETHLDSRFIISVKVQSVQKGNGSIEQIHVETWRPKSRPNGFVGPQGQSYIPSKGEKARFYCHTVEGGAPALLQPNGVLKFGTPGKGKGKDKNKP